MPPLHIAAPAKLNLCLHITGKRADGYHLLESLVAFTAFGDAIDIEPADELELSIRGAFATSFSPADDNLVMRAALKLQTHCNIPTGAKITLHKHIPVGAGLGGGSSDAAATLLGLQKLWGVAPADLQAIALSLGSDVPACLLHKTAWVQGIGEEVHRVERRGELWAVLANPRKPLLTADVYRRFSGVFLPTLPAPANFGSTAALVDYIQTKHNALETPAIELMPEIREIVAAIGGTAGCMLSRMSGSGATCFGLYAHQAQAEKAAQALLQQHPGWWCVATKVEE